MKNIKESSTKWMKMGEIHNASFIGKDIFCYGIGCHIEFIHLPTGEKRFYTANYNSANGEGVRLLIGHRVLNFFAYTECCPYTNIYVVSYPDLKKYTTLTDESNSEGYIQIAFCDIYQMITLSELPHFMFTVWNWKLTTKIAEKLSNIKFTEQLIRCNLSKPYYCLQMGIGTNVLHVWDIFISCKKCILTQHCINSPERELKFVDAVWTTEGGLYVLEASGSIYVMNIQQSLEKVVDVKIAGNLELSMIWYKNGLLVSGPTEEIRHYKKLGAWTSDWKSIPFISIKKLFTNKSENVLLAVTNDEEVVKLSTENYQEFENLTEDHSKITDFCLVNPCGDVLVILRHKKILSIFECSTGELISSLELRYSGLVLEENPEYPYICVGCEDGVLEMISLYNPKEPTIMASIYLTKNPISSIYFCENGKVILTCFKDIGEFFILGATPGVEIQIIAAIHSKLQILDYMMVASKDCYRLFFIPVTSTQFLAGNKIVRYCIIDKDTINVKEYQLEDPERLYLKIFPTSRHDRDRVFYVLPFKSKFIHELETKRADNVARLISTHSSGHLMMKMNLKRTKYYNITWAPDGFVFAKGKNLVDLHGMALPHHRRFGGVKKATIDPLGRFMISLGYENVLVCTELKNVPINEERKQNITEFMTSPKLELMFKKRTHAFHSKDSITWLEMEQQLKIKREEETCREERNALLAELKSIKTALKRLIDENEQVIDTHKLDLLEFNLDTATYKAQKQKSERDCLDTENYLKQLIVAQDLVTENLRKYLYDSLHVKSRTMNGIFCNMQTSNYAVIQDEIVEGMVNRFQKYFEIEENIKKNDTFFPWIEIPKEKLLQKIEEDPCVYEMEELETDLDDLKSNMDTEIAMYGSVSPLYVDLHSIHLRQRQSMTYFQYHMQNSFCVVAIGRLHKYFNKHFNDLRLQKEKDVSNILERNARLRHIISEINYFSMRKISFSISDPKWMPEENPEFFFKVDDSELTITPYISPSEQAILDAKAAEEERIRLLLLADDFRERALMAMMNGVLEVRWEDELRKEVPVPKCMIEKEPENFNEEDLRAIRDYEEKCAVLKSERERYKNLLTNEYAKIGINIRDIVRKFNSKFLDLLLLNMDIESARLYESLRIHRGKLWFRQRMAINQKEEDLIKQIKDNDGLIESIHKLIHSLLQDLHDCKNLYDSAQLKEKQLEKLFKRDFMDFSPIIQEQVVKLYKKRPKLSLKNIGSSTGLYELSKCIQTRAREAVLTPDCIEYLKALDNLDLFVGVPPTIDEHIYSVICKHRRARIEYEVKLRAMQIELNYTETTISTFQRRLHLKKETRANLLEEISRLRQERLHLIHNKRIQMVIKSGFVEVPLTGKTDDFKDVMMIKRKEIENVNRMIQEAGQEKLKAMKENMALHRRIMLIEWQHKKLKMHISDLEEKIKDIDAIKVTKEMQAYLKSKARGFLITTDSYETQMQMLIASFENEIKDKNDKIIKLQQQTDKLRRNNSILDKEIKDVNVDVHYYQILKDETFEEKEKELLQERLDSLMKRNGLVNVIQQNQQKIMMMQTELELLRLRTYPTFKYKLLE